PQPARLRDRLGDLLGGHRAVELSVFARAVLDREHGLGQQGRVLLGPLCGLARSLLGCLGAAPGLLERAWGRRLGELAWQQVVSKVPRGDIDRIAGLAEAVDVL